MVTLGISEILTKADNAKTTDEKVEILRKHHSTVLIDVLRMPYDKKLKWLLPEGMPPIKKNEFVGQEGNLYAEWRRMYLFFEGGPKSGPPMTQTKRESLFVQVLESLDTKDAELLCSIKDKKMPYKGITKAVVEKAFPGIYDFLKEEKTEPEKKVDG